MVGVDTTEGKSLVSVFDRSFEGCGVKETIISVVMEVGDVVGECQSIISLFGFGCSLCVHHSHDMNVRKIREVVNEDSGANIALLGREASVCWHKS